MKIIFKVRIWKTKTKIQWKILQKNFIIDQILNIHNKIFNNKTIKKFQTNSLRKYIQQLIWWTLNLKKIKHILII